MVSLYDEFTNAKDLSDKAGLSNKPVDTKEVDIF